MPRLDFHECLKRFFSRMYPDIDMETVSFHEGLPFYTRGDPSAITVGRSIYFDEGKLQPCSANGIALIAHELFHIKQGAGGPGVWFIRPFYLRYFIQKVLSGWTTGHKHPLEIPAYEQQDRVEAAYDVAVAASGQLGPCDCTDDQPPQPDKAFIEAFYEAFSG